MLLDVTFTVVLSIYSYILNSVKQFSMWMRTVQEKPQLSLWFLSKETPIVLYSNGTDDTDTLKALPMDF